MRLFSSSSVLASVPALLTLLLLGEQQQGVEAIPGGGLLWSSLNTTAVHAGNSTATFTSGPALNANQTSVFVGSAAGLIAFDLVDGKPSWLAPGVNLVPHSRPAVGRALVFASLTDGNLTAFDGATGMVKWTFPVPGVGASTPVLTPGEELVYIGPYAIQTTDGKKLWSIPPTGQAVNVTGNPSLHPDGSLVFVGDEEGGLLALDSMNGKVIWAVAAYGAIRGTPVVSYDGRTVLAASADGVLYCLSTLEGALIWSYKFGKGPLAGDLSPVVTNAGDFAVVVGGKGELIGLDALDGELLWNTTAPGGAVIMTPTLGRSYSRHLVYVGTADGTISALDVRSGDVLWLLPAVGQIVGPAPASITSDGTTLVYATADQGLLGVATDLGRELWGYGANNNDLTAVAAVAEQGKSAIVPTNRGLAHVSLATGTQGWVVPLDVAFSPLISYDGTIAYVLTLKDKALRALRVEDGEILWRVSNSSSPAFSAGPALSPKGDIIVLARHAKRSSKLQAHSSQEGQLLWEQDLPLGVVSPPLIKTVDGKELLFFGSLDKKVHAWTLDTGAPVWEYETDGWVTATPTLSPDGKTIYVGGEDSFVYALSSKDGSLKWKAAVQGGIYTPLALSIDGRYLTFTTRSGLLMCMDMAAKDPTMRIKWAIPTRTQLGGAVFSPQDLAIYVGTDAGELLAVETVSGQLMWTYEAVGPITSRPVVVEPKGAMVLVTTQNGLLTAIRALPGGHTRAHAGKHHDGVRDDLDKAEGGKKSGHRRHRQSAGMSDKNKQVLGISLTAISSLLVIAFLAFFTSKRLAARNSGKPYVVRMADLAQGQRPRGSLPKDDPDSNLKAPEKETEMEVI